MLAKHPRGKEGQADDPADLGTRDPLAPTEIFQGEGGVGLEFLPPRAALRDGLDEGAVDFGKRRAAALGDQSYNAAASFQPGGHFQFQRLAHAGDL